MESKQWYESKTIWVNLIAVLGVFLSKHFGITITEEQTVTILGVLNIVLRFITKSPVVIS